MPIKIKINTTNQNKMLITAVGDIYVYSSHFGPGTTINWELGTIGLHVCIKTDYYIILYKYFSWYWHC